MAISPQPVAKKRPHPFSELTREPIVGVVLLVILLIMGAFILYPLVMIIYESFVVDGKFSFTFLTRIFSSAYFRRTLYNTLLVAGFSTIGALFVGLVFAFGMTRTNMPLKKFFMITAILPMVTPPYLNAFAFILLFGNMGVINQVLDHLFGFKWVIYGSHGVIFAEIITFFPLAFLMVSSALSAIDPRMEEAAEDLGAPFLRVLRTVTLPLITPALLSAGLVVFMFTVSAFGTPALLGGGRLFYPEASMLAPEAIMQILGLGDWGMGTALAVVLIIPSLLFFFIQNTILKKRSYITVTGAPTVFEDRPTPPVVKWVIFSICMAVSLVVIALYLVIFAGAFTQTWGINYTLTLRHMTTAWNSARYSIQNSILLSALGALAAAFFGLVVGYFMVRKRFPGRQGVDFTAMLPYALPGVVMGLGFALAFNRAPLFLTGTWVIILINHAIRRMPFALRSSVSSLQQIDPCLEEAGADLGASWPRIFRTITFPLLRPALIAGITFGFIKTMTDITAVIFLVSPRWRLMSVDIYNYVMAGRLGVGAAVSTIMVAIILVTVGLLWKFSGLGYRIFKV